MAAGACRLGRRQAGDEVARRAGVVERMFERWFAEAKPGDKLVYWRGSVAADKVHDPALARLADRLLSLANGEFGVLSPCGHPRGLIVAAGTSNYSRARSMAKQSI